MNYLLFLQNQVVMKQQRFCLLINIIKNLLKCPALPVTFFFNFERKKLIIEEKNGFLKKNVELFLAMLLQGQQISGYSVQPFGKLQLSFIYISVSEELYYIDLLEYIFYVKFRGFNYKLYYNITLTDGLSLNDNNLSLIHI